MEIQFNEEYLQQFRSLLFPIIGKELITGYNIYRIVDKSKKRPSFQLSYFHSDLSEKDEHRTALVEKLSDYGVIHLTEKVEENIICRNASYITKNLWDDPLRTRYFDTSGNKILEETLLDFEGIIIAESLQYDMNIGVESEKDLALLIKIVNKHLYKYIRNVQGNYVLKKGEKALNPDGIPGAWDIPLISLRTDKRKIIEGFSEISEIIIEMQGNEEIMASLFIDRKTKQFLNELKSKSQEFSKIPILANSLFVDKYINADFKQFLEE